MLWRGTAFASKSMKPIQGHDLITPNDLHWRPANLMKIPNADFPERTGSENLSARLWRLPPKSANTLHKHIRQEEFYFVLEGTGRMRVGDDTLTVPRYGGVAGRLGPVAPGVQRHGHRGALAHHRRAGGTGISARLEVHGYGPLPYLPDRPEAIAQGTHRRAVAAQRMKPLDRQTLEVVNGRFTFRIAGLPRAVPPEISGSLPALHHFDPPVVCTLTFACRLRCLLGLRFLRSSS